jgi:hypothetical protein
MSGSLADGSDSASESEHRQHYLEETSIAGRKRTSEALQDRVGSGREPDPEAVQSHDQAAGIRSHQFLPVSMMGIGRQAAGHKQENWETSGFQTCQELNVRSVGAQAPTSSY